MADYKFETNLLRFIGASLYSIASMQVARELHGKSYFALGAGGKIAVDQLTFALVGTNFQSMTEEILKTGVGSSIGFQPQAQQPLPKT